MSDPSQAPDPSNATDPSPTPDPSPTADPENTIDTIPDMLQHRADVDSERRVFQFWDRHGFVADLTPKDVYRMAGKFAHLLKSWGFQKGEVIANGLPNSPERVITDFGVSMAGCVIANCQIIEKDGRDFWHTTRVGGCSGVIISARSDDPPNALLSTYLSSSSSSPSPSSSSASPSSISTSKKLSRLHNIAHDVTAPHAPTIRKVIVCDRAGSKVNKLEVAAAPLIVEVLVAGEEQEKAEKVEIHEQQQNSAQQEEEVEKHKEGKEEQIEQGTPKAPQGHDQNQQENQQKQQQPGHHLEQPRLRSFFLEELDLLNDVTQFYRADVDPTDLAVLLCTSGSTGFNKLVPLTHKYVLDSGRVHGRQGRDLLMYNDRPFGWLGGFPMDFLGSGSCRVLQDFFDNQGTKHTRDLWNLITVTKCQGAAIMPYDMIRLVDEFEHDPPEYKVWFIATGGQAIRKELSKVIGLLSHSLVVSYGCSEGGVFTMGFVTNPADLVDFYSGHPLKTGVEIRIVDGEGKEVENGKDGEIYVKSDRIIKAYYNVESPNTALKPHPKLHTEDGWYKTRDRGSIDAQGNLICFGRQGDVTSVHGVIIHLSWLESILNKCSGIQNSSVVAMIGDDDGDGDKHPNDGSGSGGCGGSDGVVFCGFVELQPGCTLTSEEMKKIFLDNLMDTDYKNKLKLSHVFIVDTLPLIPSRKVNKRGLVEMAKEKLRR